MSTDSAHLDEKVQDLLDGRLGPEERAQAEVHLAACPRCRRELESLRSVTAAARGMAHEDVPAELLTAISGVLDREDERPARAAGPLAWLTLRPALALGLVALLALSVWIVRRSRPSDLPSAAAQDYLDYRDARLSIDLRTASPTELERLFAANGITFETRVFDLGMMGYRVAGGRVHRLAGRPSALFVYEGPDGKRLLCQMYPGTLSDLPPTTAVRENNGIVFRVYHKDGLTLVFWQEGDVVCVLVSHIAPEEVLQLAFAKAMKVAALLRAPSGG